MKTKLTILALITTTLTLIATPAHAQCGQASWYGPGFHGNLTANGEVFNQNALTAAHPSLPFGTRVRVTWNNRSVDVRINDRGPFTGGRIIDLSAAAASRLGMRDIGVAQVCIRRL
jgi:rare lipoprotein A